MIIFSAGSFSSIIPLVIILVIFLRNFRFWFYFFHSVSPCFFFEFWSFFYINIFFRVFISVFAFVLSEIRRYWIWTRSWVITSRVFDRISFWHCYTFVISVLWFHYFVTNQGRDCISRAGVFIRDELRPFWFVFIEL